MNKIKYIAGTILAHISYWTSCQCIEKVAYASSMLMGEMGQASLMLQDEAVHGHHQGSLMLLDEAVHGHLRHPKRKRRSLTPFPELGSGVFWLTYRCDFIDRELRALKKSKKIFVNKKIPLTNREIPLTNRVSRMQLFFIAKFIEPPRCSSAVSIVLSFFSRRHQVKPCSFSSSRSKCAYQ